MDCYTIHAALQGLRVAVDERDISMDAALQRELEGTLAARGHMLDFSCQVCHTLMPLISFHFWHFMKLQLDKTDSFLCLP